MTPDLARELLYNDCAPGVAAAAAENLRPQHWGLWTDPCPLDAWPDLPTIGLACRHDRMLGEQGMIQGSARVSAPLRWLGTDHSPMLSAPDELARILVRGVRDDLQSP